MKPMLAENYKADKLRYPLIVQPKTDGVRGLHLNNSFTGRSLKPHANIYTTTKFNDFMFCGLDGELFLGPKNNWISQSLCRDTTSALNSVNGAPDIYWKVFDLINPATINLPYVDRLEALRNRVEELAHPKIIMVPYFYIYSKNDLEDMHNTYLAMGFEGTILRDPQGKYKEGRSTIREGGLLRIKDFIEEEATVLSLEEGNANNNEATVNELGRTERSTHQGNMEPNGMIGAMLCLTHKTKETIRVSAGAMTHSERLLWFQEPEKIVGKSIKYKHFPKGVKDKPRFATFVAIKMESDMP